MFGRIFLARAETVRRAEKRDPDGSLPRWQNAVDYGERVVDGERFLFSYCRFCGERLAGVSLRRYDRAGAARRLRFSVDQHLHAGCPAQPPSTPSGRPAR